MATERLPRAARAVLGRSPSVVLPMQDWSGWMHRTLEGNKSGRVTPINHALLSNRYGRKRLLLSARIGAQRGHGDQNQAHAEDL